MTFLLAFWGFILGALAVSWRAGDRRDRRMIVIIMIAAAGTSLVHLWLDDSTAIAAAFAIDLGLLAIVIRYSLASARHWPVWFAGFHAASVIIGMGSLAMPDQIYVVAQRIGAFWSLPALLAMTIGLVVDRKKAVIQHSA